MRTTLLTLLCGLALSLSGATPAAAQATDQRWGATSARDQAVHRGCHNYPYRYRLNPPTEQWSAETFLVGPRGGKLGSGYFLSGGDPLAGRSAFRLCRASLKTGTYTIRMKVSYIDGYDLVTGKGKTSRFRITRR